MHRTRLPIVIACAALLLAATGAQGASSDVVISQVYAGGGNAGASYTNDYVELLNRGSSAVDVSGWTVQYATAAGTTWQTTTLTGSVTIPAGAPSETRIQVTAVVFPCVPLLRQPLTTQAHRLTR